MGIGLLRLYALALLVAGFARAAVTASGENVWTLGVMLSLDGADSYVQSLDRIIRLAVADINAADQILPGIMLQTANLDDSNRAVQFLQTRRYSAARNDLTVKNAISFGSNSSIVGIIGEITSDNSIPLSYVATAFNVPQCSPTATLVTLSNRTIFPVFFRPIPPDNYQAPAIVSFVLSVGWKRAIMVYSSGSYGSALAKGVAYSSSIQGLEIDLQASYPADVQSQSDFTNTAAQLVGLRNRLVLFLGEAVEFVYYTRAARALGVDGPDYTYVGSDGTYALFSLLSNLNITDDDRSSMRGLLSVTAMEQSNTSVAESIDQRYASLYNAPVVPGSYFTYDCVVVLAYLLRQMMNQGASVSDIHYHRANVPSAASLPGFIGATGNVTFDALGNRLAPFLVANLPNTSGALNMVAQVLINGTVIMGSSQIVFRNGQTIVPSDMQVLQVLVINYTDPLPLVIVSIYVIGLILTLMSGVFVLRNRRVKIIQNLSFPCIMMTIVGLTMSWLSIFTLVGKTTNLTCATRDWIFWFGFGTVEGTMLARAWRIWRIFDNEKMQLRPMSYLFLLSISLTVVVVNGILIGVGSLLSPRVPVAIDGSNYVFYDCVLDLATAAGYMSRVQLGLNGLVLISITILSFKSRNARIPYQESTWIMYSTSFSLMTFIMASLVLVVNQGQSSPISNFYTKTITSLMAYIVMLYCLVGRVVWEAMGQLRAGERKGSQDLVQGLGELWCKPRNSVQDDDEEPFVRKSFSVVMKSTGSLFSTWVAHEFVVYEGPSLVLCIFKKDHQQAGGSDCFEITFNKRCHIVQCESPAYKRRLLAALQCTT
ncbi:periplasmic binding protein-like I [Polychytrium aggregatum]|uniref:periplasmic binding protein-like I n=1 Tax=Polychytrium aggregatum TaxID=110093 RepID=UPI0022FE6A5F|nr:periplasmic binding protein-like I [Polychytrium aggregatum]KAI9209202.1 periplasmic binding protein-like I [Polychytrium aggregatum]